MAERACEESEAWFDGELLCQQLPEHERQNPAMSIIIDFDRSIDSQQEWRRLTSAVSPLEVQGRCSPRRELVADIQMKALGTIKPERLRADTFR